MANNRMPPSTENTFIELLPHLANILSISLLQDGRPTPRGIHVEAEEIHHSVHSSNSSEPFPF